MDWTSVLDADPEWKNSFLPVWSEVTFDGGVYAIPRQFITNEVVYYNSDIVKKAGYDTFPTVWEDMLTLCGKLKNMGYMPIALGIMGGWPLWSHLGEPLCEYLCGVSSTLQVQAVHTGVSPEGQKMAIAGNVDMEKLKGYAKKLANIKE